ncbi:MAG: cyclic pyranopterin monophosphate synthase MoaC [Planctomycetaceae bacterium]|nr:cyclic pyranopterin monophosphate synthase MoaC [Planctomycetaceae bacterium]
MASQLGHLVVDPEGARARMVDVGQKSASERSALARARVHLPARAFEALASGNNPKGPVEEVARVAGVLAAKSTDRLIPLCHSIPLTFVDVTFVRGPGPRIDVLCEARCHGVTGVEMEALVGASVAALTVYDMLKGLDHGIRVEAVELLEKRGGRSGTWRAAGYDGAE